MAVLDNLRRKNYAISNELSSISSSLLIFDWAVLIAVIAINLYIAIIEIPWKNF